MLEVGRKVSLKKRMKGHLYLMVVAALFSIGIAAIISMLTTH
ncbi:MAG: hypothetical protein SCARUB_03112 [Candidatus Scalindua rubra]|uniref:Uncharacterized protein n=1 Tax=Candidatus Scalindua rubra TaxID=1872076 RepID=A0A1E3X9V8_9BACT|nr:MAG: hypothetical protein SCARUB_03112 [Candidatus Scalindua rubra]